MRLCNRYKLPQEAPLLYVVCKAQASAREASLVPVVPLGIELSACKAGITSGHTKLKRVINQC